MAENEIKPDGEQNHAKDHEEVSASYSQPENTQLEGGRSEVGQSTTSQSENAQTGDTTTSADACVGGAQTPSAHGSGDQAGGAQTDPRLTQRRETPMERARRYGASPALGLGIYDDPEDAKANREKKAAKGPKKPRSLKSIVGKAFLLVVCIAIIIIAFLPSLAGTLNVNVISSDDPSMHTKVQVAVYQGDVIAQLVDSDVSNDPSAIETKDVVVGQRAVFNMKEFGTYTVAVTAREDIQNWTNPAPITVGMMGLDSRITIDINE